MSEQTLEAPAIQAPVSARRELRPRPTTTVAELTYRYRWLLTAAGLLVVSLLLVLWAGTRPGYDPYGWLVWGKLTIHWNLDTNGAPSWKPLPYVFTVPFAVLGHYALWLWMVTSVAISLSGVIFAWRIAFTLTRADPARRYASYAAGLAAAVALLAINNYTHFIFSSQSDTMIVSLCLAAIDCQLSGRLRWAFWCWLLAGLGRPEAWPFLGLYSLWMWRSTPSFRRVMVAGLLLIPLLWFGIPALTAKTAFIAGSNALNSPRELHNNKFFGTIHRFLNLQPIPIELAALAAIGLAVLRRDRITSMLAAGTVLWVLVEGAFALHGWPAVPRYLFEPAAVTAVLCGIFVGRVILDLPPRIAEAAGRLESRRPSPRLATRLGSWGAILVLAVLAGSLLPQAASRYRIERQDLRHERARTAEINRLSRVVRILGASRILACGQPNIPIAYQSVFAWYAGVKIGVLYVSPSYERLHPHPLVNIVPISRGWKVFPSHVDAPHAASCRGLRRLIRS